MVAGQKLVYPGPRVYLSKAYILEVTDGDTCIALVHPGFRGLEIVELRLRRINARETRSPVPSVKRQGEKDRAQLALLLDLHACGTEYGMPVVEVQTFRTRNDTPRKSFDRYIAEVWGRALRVPSQPLNINEEMVDTGHAEWDLDHAGIMDSERAE